MGLKLLTNTAALRAGAEVNRVNKENIASITKLSSGSRASSIRDDATLVTIGARTDARISALKQVLANTSQATSTLQTVDSAFDEISKVLEKQTILANRASSGQVSDNRRLLLDQEFKSLSSQINGIINSTAFNNGTLFNEETTINTVKSKEGLEITSSNQEGYLQTRYNKRSDRIYLKVDGQYAGRYDFTSDKGKGEIDFEIAGVNFKLDESKFNLSRNFGYTTGLISEVSKESVFDIDFNIGLSPEKSKLRVRFNKSDSQYLGLNDATLKSQEDAKLATEVIIKAQERLSLTRAKVGSSLSRLDFAYSNTSIALENNQAAKSSLLDVDIAAETVKLATNQYILKSGVFLMAQANQQTSNLLELIK